jgi:RNA polymerase sigma-70 factor, ECF subfamily
MALHAPFFVLLHRRVQSRWPYREEAMHAASAATLDSSRRTNTNLEGALVEQMATGDVEALGVLCDRWADAVRALVVRIVSDEADADDVVEAVFWQAWCQADRYEKNRGAAGAWLLTMARSRAIDCLRTRRRRREDLSVDSSIFDSQPALSDPFSELNARERASRVVSAMQSLPDEQRQVLELAYFAGLSQSEISGKLSLPLGTVKTRARLALRKMRDRLEVLRENQQ